MTKKIYIYDFRNFKSYLLAICGGKTLRRGVKTELAEAAQCQPTYLSRVLHGKAQLSAEQAVRISRFLNHTKTEAKFFILLLQKERAGTNDLKEFFQDQIEEQVIQHMNVVNRLGASSVLTEEQRATYYSSWPYAAIHMAITIPSLRTDEALAHHFGLSLKRVRTTLDFLVAAGLAIQNKNTYQTGNQVIRLGKESPYIVPHHSHWREQSIDSLQRETDLDLHYSAVITLSQSDVLKLKERMLENIKENIDVVRASKEEVVYAYTLDFFNLKKG